MVQFPPLSGKGSPMVMLGETPEDVASFDSYKDPFDLGDTMLSFKYTYGASQGGSHMFEIKAISPSEIFEKKFLGLYMALFGDLAEAEDLGSIVPKTLQVYVRWGYSESELFASRAHKATLMKLDFSISDKTERMVTIQFGDMGTATARFAKHSVGNITDSAKVDLFEYGASGTPTSLKSPGNVAVEVFADYCATLEGITSVSLLKELANRIDLIYFSIVESISRDPDFAANLKPNSKMPLALPESALQNLKDDIQWAKAQKIISAGTLDTELPYYLSVATDWVNGKDGYKPYALEAYKMMLNTLGIHFYFGFQTDKSLDTGAAGVANPSNNQNTKPKIDFFEEGKHTLIHPVQDVYRWDDDFSSFINYGSLESIIRTYRTPGTSGTVSHIFYDVDKISNGAWFVSALNKDTSATEYREAERHKWSYAGYLQETMTYPNGNIDFMNNGGLPMLKGGTGLECWDGFFWTQVAGKRFGNPDPAYMTQDQVTAAAESGFGDEDGFWLVPLDKLAGKKYYFVYIHDSQLRAKVVQSLAAVNAVGKTQSTTSQKSMAKGKGKSSIPEGTPTAWASLAKTKYDNTWDVIDNFVDKASELQLLFDRIENDDRVSLQQFDWHSLTASEKSSFIESLGQLSLPQAFDGAAFREHLDKKNRVLLIASENLLKGVFTSMRRAIEMGLDEAEGRGININTFPAVNNAPEDMEDSSLVFGVGTKDSIVTDYKLNMDLLLPIAYRARAYMPVKRMQDMFDPDKPEMTAQNWIRDISVEITTAVLQGSLTPGKHSGQEASQFAAFAREAAEGLIPPEKFLEGAINFLANFGDVEPNSILARKMQQSSTLRDFYALVMNPELRSLFYDDVSEYTKYIVQDSQGALAVQERADTSKYIMKNDAITAITGGWIEKYIRQKTLEDRRYGEFSVIANVRTLGIPEISSDYYDLRFRPIKLIVLNPRGTVPGAGGPLGDASLSEHWSSGIYKILGYTHTISHRDGYSTDFTLQKDPLARTVSNVML